MKKMQFSGVRKEFGRDNDDGRCSFEVEGAAE